MGKTKNQNHRRDEDLLGQLREAKKEIKRKDQRIRQLEKNLLFKEPKKERKSRKEEPKCLECGKGELRIMDIGVRRFTICNLCANRIRIDQ